MATQTIPPHSGVALPAGVERLIDSATLTAALSWTSGTWTAGKYRQVRIVCNIKNHTATFLTFPGIASGYKTYYTGGVVDASNIYVNTSTDAGSTAFSNTLVLPLTTGKFRTSISDNWGVKSDGTPFGVFQYFGFCSNTATDITGLTLTFTSAADGEILVYGILA